MLLILNSDISHNKNKILAFWASKWDIKLNATNSVHITFTTRTESCPPVYINNTEIPSSNEVKYLGKYLD